eukprot:TRINITY_DN11183_c2_g1_i1.p1 TRINITY_DN11183_c2_g1~~TRINITY_DN11183_c2_g1_i1.p1  ORF type:complete len:652 (+),score=225.87 TRINITY_DN11183_c2_g1_i1:77-2032(+)
MPPSGQSIEGEEEEEEEECEEECEEEASSSSSSGGPAVPVDPTMLRVQAQPHGLLNVGNTCYLNSGVQVLVHCNALAMMLAEQHGEVHTRRLRGVEDARRQEFVKSWRRVFAAFTQTHTRVIDPTWFVRDFMAVNHSFAGFSQQCASEFVRTVLGAADDELRQPFHPPRVLESLGVAPAGAAAPPSTSWRRPADPQAARQLQLLRFLDAVYTRNIALDQAEYDRKALAQKKGLTFTSAGSGAYYPKVYRSLTGELFEGLYASVRRCSSCGYESVRIEPHAGLPLEIVFSSPKGAAKPPAPLDPQQAQVARPDDGTWLRSLAYAPYTLSRFLLASTFDVLKDLMRAAWAMIGNPLGESGPPLGLRESLDSHFGEEVMDDGGNLAECAQCKRPTPGTKQLALLSLPEYLVVTLKRFKQTSPHGGFQKINGHIPFPVDVGQGGGDAPAVPPTLDLAEYCYTQNGALEPPIGTEYQLKGLVAHRGGYTGGHYVSYVLTEGQWVMCNDELLGLVPPAQVAAEHAYMLVYQKRPPPGGRADAALIATSRQYLARLLDHGSSCERLLEALLGRHRPEELAFIPRQWLVKHAYTSDPGVIFNQPCYPFGADPTPTRSARDFYCPVLRTDWDAYVKAYGGAPLVTVPDFVALVRKWEGGV